MTKQEYLNKETQQNIKDIQILLNELKLKTNFDFKDFATLSTIYLNLLEMQK